MLQRRFKEWNKVSFGDVKAEEKRIEERIRDLDSLDESGRLLQVRHVQRAELRLKFEEVVFKEETMWSQR